MSRHARGICIPCGLSDAGELSDASEAEGSSALAGLSLQEAIEHFKAVAQSRDAADGRTPGSDMRPRQQVKRERAAKEIASVRRDRVLSDDYLNAALAGQHLKSGWRRAMACTCKGLFTGWCGEGLFTRDELQLHLQLFESACVDGSFIPISQEARSAQVYSTIDGMWYATAATQQKRVWHWRYKDREVCRGVFLMYFPVGSSTLYTLQHRKEKGAPYAHDKIAQQGDLREQGALHNQKALSIIGWYKYYSHQVCQG